MRCFTFFIVMIIALVRDLMLETGTLDHSIEFNEYVDIKFAEGAKSKTAWAYEPGGLEAR